MKRRFFALLLVLVLTVTACGSSKSSETTTKPAEAVSTTKASENESGKDNSGTKADESTTKAGDSSKTDESTTKSGDSSKTDESTTGGTESTTEAVTEITTETTSRGGSSETTTESSSQTPDGQGELPDLLGVCENGEYYNIFFDIYLDLGGDWVVTPDSDLNKDPKNLESIFSANGAVVDMTCARNAGTSEALSYNSNIIRVSDQEYQYYVNQTDEFYDALVAEAQPQMEEAMKGSGFTDIKVYHEEGTFLGKTVPCMCIDMTNANGDVYIQKQATVVRQLNGIPYVMTITAGSFDKATTDKMLASFENFSNQ